MVTLALRLSTATVATTAMLELLDLTSKLVQPASITLLELQVALASHVLVAATVTKLNKLLVKQDFIAISQRLLLPTVFMNHVQLELMQMLPEQPAKLLQAMRRWKSLPTTSCSSSDIQLCAWLLLLGRFNEHLTSKNGEPIVRPT